MIYRLRRVIKDQGGIVRVLKKALGNPRVAIKSGLRIFYSNWIALLFENRADWDRYIQEQRSDGFLDGRLQVLGDKFSELSASYVRGHAVTPGGMRTLHAELVYALVRDRKPSIVFETGVCNGVSSGVILYAMAKNQHGNLVSIDLPEFSDPDINRNTFWEGKGGAVIPAAEQPGWLVPHNLRDRWRLELGRCQDLLQPLLEENGPIDIFIHDSEHSYVNQLFEFTHGYKALKKGGVLIATDINWSEAFDVFWKQVRKRGAKCAFVDPSCAVVIKPGE